MARAPIDIVAVAEAYEGRGLPRAAFYQLLDDALQVKSLCITGLDWTLLDHMLSTVRNLPLTAHFGALAEGAGISYDGLEAFLDIAISAGLFDQDALRRTEIEPPSHVPGDFGRLLVQLGLASKDQVEQAEDIRDRVSDALGLELALGCILRSVVPLSVADFVQALAVFRGVSVGPLDAMAEEVYDASCQAMTLTTRTTHIDD